MQVCAVAPLGKFSSPTPISNSARTTFIPVPARDMLSIQSIETQAENSCKHRNVNPKDFQDSILTLITPRR